MSDLGVDADTLWSIIHDDVPQLLSELVLLKNQRR
jgi:hypothetical protein